jgi:NTE family protein
VTKRRRRGPAARLLWAALVVLSWTFLVAAEPRAATRPKVGLALSGGGARGAAHIGVLKVLEERRVPVDFIAGTSMGALVGGLYASGLTAAELERVITEVDWTDAFADRIPRADRSFRRKRDDDLYLVKHKPGLRGGQLLFPPGLIDGQQIDLLLKRHTLPVVTVRDFDELSIPYRAVAADIVTGEAVVLDHGDLAMALRASMAIPAVFAPREIDGRLLVDGGITENLPIDVVRRMGADVVIAVDIGTPPAGREALRSVPAITMQLTSLLSEQNRRRQVASLGEADVFIRPDLGTIATASFDRAAETVPIGARAAEAEAAQLDRLALSAADWRAHVAARRRPAGRVAVDELRIVNDSRLGDDAIAARLGPLAGGPLDVDRLETDLDQVFGLELFESVYYDVEREVDRNVLTVSARERSWGPDYLQAGIAAFEDHEGPDFNVALAYSRTAVNRRNGEWRTGVQAGRDPGGFTEWHQPVDRALRAFVHVRLSAWDRAVGAFDATGHKTAELEVRHAGVELSAGRELGTWGELRAGLVRESGEISTEVGDAGAPDAGFDTGDAFLQFHVDRLDDVDFPRSGGGLRARFTAGLRGLGSDARYEQASLEGSLARTWGSLTGRVGGMLGSTLDGDAPTQSLFALGGFSRLSGLQQDELAGQHAALLSAAVYRRLAAVPLAPLHAGLSAEYGNVFATRERIRARDGIASAGVFLGLDTVVGPVLLAYARAEGGRSNYYLSLGETFHRRRLGSWRR